MPTITNPGVIPAMVTAFLINGRDKGKAGLEVGYSQSYVKNGDCAKLWDRSDVRLELKRQEIELRKKTGRTLEEIDYMYQHAYDLAEQRGDPNTNSMNGSALGIARLHGFDKDNNLKDPTVIIINPPKSVKNVESEVIDEV